MCWFVNPNKTGLLEFMVKVAKSPDLQARYKANPQAVMKSEGLSDEDQKLLLSQDREQFINSIAGRH